MSCGEPPYIDTAAYFVRNRMRGTLMRGNSSATLKDQSRSWRRVPIRVHNARLLDPPATLATHGFELVRFDTAVDPRQSIGERLEIYCAESRRIVEALTGCKESRTLNEVFRGGFHGLRPGDPLDRNAPRSGAVSHYAEHVHTDVSPWLELRPEWNDLVQGRHGGIFNVWRSTDLERPVEHMPLAVCRDRNVAPRDMVAAWTLGLIADGSGFVSYYLAHDAFQHWFSYPRMTPDEALVFRLYDTREAVGSRRGVFHAAVADPGTPPGSKQRESVDIRIGAVFERETEADERRARFLAELPPVPDTWHRSVEARSGKPLRAD